MYSCTTLNYENSTPLNAILLKPLLKRKYDHLIGHVPQNKPSIINE